MKCGQLIEYNARNIFLQKSCRKRSKDVKASDQHVSFDYFDKPRLG